MVQALVDIDVLKNAVTALLRFDENHPTIDVSFKAQVNAFYNYANYCIDKAAASTFSASSLYVDAQSLIKSTQIIKDTAAAATAIDSASDIAGGAMTTITNIKNHLPPDSDKLPTTVAQYTAICDLKISMPLIDNDIKRNVIDSAKLTAAKTAATALMSLSDVKRYIGEGNIGQASMF
jgi:hypothetical protein